MGQEQRVPCIEGTTDMSCEDCQICRFNSKPTQAVSASVYSCPKMTASNGDSLSLGRVCALLLLLGLIATADGCGPGRGIGRRRNRLRLTPLVFKQHVPNMSEQTLGAAGMSEGAVKRSSPQFKKLEFNNNRDIIFKDEEGTGADHVMTRRCKEKLNSLAISVMNQWPGVRLRVTESWDEEYLHDANSLHYEGRAVDITTSDRDRSKYGMLARLAVEAGFDWVYYETRAHIHCSVKSDSSHIPHDNGCFAKDSSVLMADGHRKAMSDLAIGDRVLSVDENGDAIYSEVILFMDRNVEVVQEFVQIRTEGGAELTVTPAHLVLVWKREESASDYVFADRVEEGHHVFVHDSTGAMRPQRVVELRAVLRKGVVAPLTKEGTIVVDSVAASCYAVVSSQSLAHWSLAPMRLWAAIQRIVSPRSHAAPAATPQQRGVHWYARALYALKRVLVPRAWRY